MRNVFLFFITITVLSSVSYGQDDFSFKKEPIKDGFKVVSFKLAGLSGEQQIAEMESFLQDNDSVFYVKIYPTSKCYMKLQPGTDANYIRALLLEKGAEYDFTTVDRYVESSVEVNVIPIPYEFEEKEMPEGFPKKVDTGDPYEDELRLAKEVKKWREENPEEWKKMLENRKSNNN